MLNDAKSLWFSKINVYSSNSWQLVYLFKDYQPGG